MASKAPKGLYPGSLGGRPHPTMMYKATGEFRPPKEGEFYLSGAIVQAWQTANDLSTSYWIAVPVEMIRCPHCQGTGKIEKPKPVDFTNDHDWDEQQGRCLRCSATDCSEPCDNKPTRKQAAQ